LSTLYDKASAASCAPLNLRANAVIFDDAPLDTAGQKKKYYAGEYNNPLRRIAPGSAAERITVATFFEAQSRSVPAAIPRLCIENK
jgi:hypothetical protein